MASFLNRQRHGVMDQEEYGTLTRCTLERERWNGWAIKQRNIYISELVPRPNGIFGTEEESMTESWDGMEVRPSRRRPTRHTMSTTSRDHDTREVTDVTASVAGRAYQYCRDHPVVTQTLSDWRLPRDPSCGGSGIAAPVENGTEDAPSLDLAHILDHGDTLDFLETTSDSPNETFPGGSVPCRIRDGPFLRACFAEARRLWLQDDDDGTMDRDWFRQTVTPLVPVRVAPDDTASAVLDAQGRATEGRTQPMTMPDYINHVLENREEEDAASAYYLKDWHLQQWLERHRATEIEDTENTRRNDSTASFLYTLPDHLPYDLLNGFLLRFGGGSSEEDSETNDYRFVYWGPPGSTTALHSDVLQSLSWSYNVCGAKEWTFYVPTEISGKGEDEVQVVVLQNAGDLVMVPSGWKHSVVNLEETLSINHNWITADILPHVWACIQAELRAVDDALAAWSIDDFGARESMLRGCVGLNVSLFSFMLLTRGLDLLRDIWSEEDPVLPHVADASGHKTKRIRDLVGICGTLRVLISSDSDEVHWTDRLVATLQNEDAGRQVQQMVTDLIEFVEEHM
jgi:JmjC domain, hydroxylase